MIFQVEKKEPNTEGTILVYQVEAKCLSDALIAIELDEVAPVDHFQDTSEREKFRAFIIGG